MVMAAKRAYRFYAGLTPAGVDGTLAEFDTALWTIHSMGVHPTSGLFWLLLEGWPT